MTDYVLYALDSRIATLTINRPETLNSIDIATVAALIAGVERALHDEAAVLILTGAGRAFCSGADLSAALGQDLAPEDLDLGAPMRSHYGVLVQRLCELPIPVVIAVNGIAAGGGCSLALSGDIVIAAQSAAFRQTFIDIGLMPDMGATWMMPRLVGRARARGMALLGEPIPAAMAADWGMIWAVVDDAALQATAREIATKLADRSPSALRASRRALDEGLANDYAIQLELEAVGQTALGREPAFTAAVRAFLARRSRAKP
jgi:2-(1,2-epoxy-1,2-dihydrophenyl)acetyl-CoA isomerase